MRVSKYALESKARELRSLVADRDDVEAQQRQDESNKALAEEYTRREEGNVLRPLFGRPDLPSEPWTESALPSLATVEKITWEMLDDAIAELRQLAARFVTLNYCVKQPGANPRYLAELQGAREHQLRLRIYAMKVLERLEKQIEIRGVATGEIKRDVQQTGEQRTVIYLPQLTADGRALSAAEWEEAIEKLEASRVKTLPPQAIETSGVVE